MCELNKIELVTLAEECFENGQYVNVITYMKEVIRLECPLNFSERLLIFDSFFELKNPFYNILENENINERLHNDTIINAEKAVCNLCKDAIYLLDKNPVEKDISKESIADYKWFEGVQYHDLALCAINNGNDEYKNKALQLYKEARRIADDWVNAAHPVRLCIANSYCDLLSALLDNDEEALRISKDAYDKAFPCINNLSNSLKDRAEEELQHLREKNEQI